MTNYTLEAVRGATRFLRDVVGGTVSEGETQFGRVIFYEPDRSIVKAYLLSRFPDQRSYNTRYDSEVPVQLAKPVDDDVSTFVFLPFEIPSRDGYEVRRNVEALKEELAARIGTGFLLIPAHHQTQSDRFEGVSEGILNAVAEVFLLSKGYFTRADVGAGPDVVGMLSENTERIRELAGGTFPIDFKEVFGKEVSFVSYVKQFGEPLVRNDRIAYPEKFCPSVAVVESKHLGTKRYILNEARSQLLGGYHTKTTHWNYWLWHGVARKYIFVPEPVDLSEQDLETLSRDGIQVWVLGGNGLRQISSEVSGAVDSGKVQKIINRFEAVFKESIIAERDALAVLREIYNTGSRLRLRDVSPRKLVEYYDVVDLYRRFIGE